MVTDKSAGRDEVVVFTVAVDLLAEPVEVAVVAAELWRRGG